MTQRGQLKMPVQSFKEAFQHVIEAIDSCEAGVAVFMLGGRVLCTKRTSRAFSANVNRLASGLVGVYDSGADCRCVKEDLMEFYRRPQ